jgi:hypothetical protein
MKEEEYHANLQMKDHFDVGMEIVVLDLILENAQLKNRVEALKAERTPATSNDFSSFERDALVQNLENESRSVKSRSSYSENPVPRCRSSMVFLSKFLTTQMPCIKLTGIRTRDDKRRTFLSPMIVPKRICTHFPNLSDDLSDLEEIRPFDVRVTSSDVQYDK